jgi:hypothetical protein
MQMTKSFICHLLCGVAFLSPATPVQSADSPPIPEVARLAKMFAGDWNTVEIVQHGKPVPDGAGRRGTVHVRLTGGGTALVSEGHSVGTVGGELQWFIRIWWGLEREVLSLSHLLQDAN